MAATRPSTRRVNHLVLNVRDIEASHRFYTEVLGFEQCGTLKTPLSPTRHALLPQRPRPPPRPRADPDSRPGVGAAGASVADLRQPPGPRPPGHRLRHAARSGSPRCEHLQAIDVPIALRGNHGMTHSAYIVDPDGHGIEVLYELPAEVWEGDVDAALSYFELLPDEGPRYRVRQDTAPTTSASAPELHGCSHGRTTSTAWTAPRREVWLGGERVDDVDRAPAAGSRGAGHRRVLRPPARAPRRAASIPDPETGEAINVSHMQPALGRRPAAAARAACGASPS